MIRTSSRLLLDAYQTAVEACHGRQVTLRALGGPGEPLAGFAKASAFRRIRLLGAGKAAHPMAQAIQLHLGSGEERGRFQGGLVVTKDGHRLPAALTSGDPSLLLPPVEVLETAHPIPDERSVAAGRRLLAEAEALGPEDLMIFVLSGGASSLIEVPAPGLSLEDLRLRNDALLRSGLPIEGINAERRRLSAIKGGQLAEHTRASILTLILSDVPGGGPEVVGSGPTLATYPPRDPRHHALVVADHREALRQTAVFLRGAGVEVVEEAPGKLCQAPARAHGASLGDVWKIRSSRPVARLWSGEAPVVVRGGGRGGRNQELALAAALALRGSKGATVAALATDGQDGSTDACGAIVDGDTAGKIEAVGLDPRRCLEENDAYTALSAAKALVPSRATHTNVNDLCLVLVEPWASG